MTSASDTLNSYKRIFCFTQLMLSIQIMNTNSLFTYSLSWCTFPLLVGIPMVRRLFPMLPEGERRVWTTCDCRRRGVALLLPVLNKV